MGSLWRGARFRSVSRSEAAHVVVRGQVIHRVQQLVYIDERSHCDERAEDAPQPECRGGDRDGQTARGLFFADAAGYAVIPHQPADAQRDLSHQEEHQAVVHCVFAVAFEREQVQACLLYTSRCV